MRTVLVVLFIVAIATPWRTVEAKKRTTEDDDNEEASVGSPVRRGAFPNVGVLFMDGRHICGCTLVNPNHVLTAASCISVLKQSEASKLSVHLNTVALKTFNPGAVISKVTKFKIHESYDKSTQLNDIALLTLDTTVTTLYPLALPAAGTTDDFIGKNGTILRWGEAKSATTNYKILLQAPVSIISNVQCGGVYGKTINDKFLCASSALNVPATCHDDSEGGPIIVDGRQVGIKSWGKGCMDANYPGVYTRLTSFLDWISSNIA